uniref:Cleavage stimulation factor 50 kDa subunit n=1 Tax=Leersia perrieri TaxID=77586 RepID=A0A0D9VZ53_9ORYZ
MDAAVQEAKLLRQVNALIVAHLRDQSLTQAASAVAAATMTPLAPPDDSSSIPTNQLLRLVAKVPPSALFSLRRPSSRLWGHASGTKPSLSLLCWFAQGLAVEREEAGRGEGGGASVMFDSAAAVGFGGLLPPLGTNAVDFSVQDVKGPSKSFPKHESRHVSDHKQPYLFSINMSNHRMAQTSRKNLGAYIWYHLQFALAMNVVRCAKFSPDGKYFASGSGDTSIKFFEVAKIKQMMLGDSKDGPVRPVIRTFYDHTQPINDLDFHPESSILISAAKDNTIRFFDFSKSVARKAFRVIQVDTHNVRSVCFHPCGDYLLAGTDHPVAHLYDINTFTCYLSANSHDSSAAINQARYSSTGSLYVTASKDGSLRIWDGISAECVRPIIGAHGSAEVTSAIFTKDERYVLSCGKDSCIKLWEVGSGRFVKQYVGAVHRQFRCQVVVWDALTAENVARLPSGHTGAPRWIGHSPVEPAFVTCGNDRSVRFWKQTV